MGGDDLFENVKFSMRMGSDEMENREIQSKDVLLSRSTQVLNPSGTALGSLSSLRINEFSRAD